MDRLRVKIEKLVFGGQAMGKAENGQTVFVWNALPGEEVMVDILKKKKNYIEAVAVESTSLNKERIKPLEDHYLSCSPWQIMSIDYENQWKKLMAEEVYKRIGDLDLNLEIEPGNEQYGYRAKMEYSLVASESGKISLAFFPRGGKKKYAIKDCCLASACINKAAEHILCWINENKISERSLKSIILRSNEKEEVIAGLFIKDRLSFSKYPKLKNQLIGFQLYYSTHLSPASVPTDLLYSSGADFIITKLNNLDFKSGLFSFFQVNLPMFVKALEEIKAQIGTGHTILDYYSGVGAIGLSLSNDKDKVFLVDSNKEAIRYAKENISTNKLKNCHADCCVSEKMTELLGSDKIVIIDPPRAGLHQDFVLALLETRPVKIAYLSCDLSTQARDLKLLSKEYKVSFAKLYNFFPRTPHVEGLVILESK